MQMRHIYFGFNLNPSERTRTVLDPHDAQLGAAQEFQCLFRRTGMRIRAHHGA
jgi:hypothetical protein